MRTYCEPTYTVCGFRDTICANGLWVSCSYHMEFRRGIHAFHVGRRIFPDKYAQISIFVRLATYKNAAQSP